MLVISFHGIWAMSAVREGWVEIKLCLTKTRGIGKVYSPPSPEWLLFYFNWIRTKLVKCWKQVQRSWAEYWLRAECRLERDKMCCSSSQCLTKKIIRKYRPNVDSFVMLADEVSELQRYHRNLNENYDSVMIIWVALLRTRPTTITGWRALDCVASLLTENTQLLNSIFKSFFEDQSVS